MKEGKMTDNGKKSWFEYWNGDEAEQLCLRPGRGAVRSGPGAVPQPGNHLGDPGRHRLS